MSETTERAKLIRMMRRCQDESSGIDNWPWYTYYKDTADLLEADAARIAELERELDLALKGSEMNRRNYEHARECLLDQEGKK